MERKTKNTDPSIFYRILRVTDGLYKDRGDNHRFSTHGGSWKSMTALRSALANMRIRLDPDTSPMGWGRSREEVKDWRIVECHVAEKIIGPVIQELEEQRLRLAEAKLKREEASKRHEENEEFKRLKELAEKRGVTLVYPPKTKN